MKCDAVLLEISNYIDGEVDSVIRQEIEIHLSGCEGCAVIVNQTKRTVEIFCASQPVELPQDVRDRLHQALHRKLNKPAI